MLTGVPETGLWTLCHRSPAARKGVLDDPRAIALVEALDHPFEERFGGGETATWQALRVRAFDNEIRRVLHAKPDATVVALGEVWRRSSGAWTMAVSAGSRSNCRSRSHCAARSCPAGRRSPRPRSTRTPGPGRSPTWSPRRAC